MHGIWKSNYMQFLAMFNNLKRWKLHEQTPSMSIPECCRIKKTFFQSHHLPSPPPSPQQPALRPRSDRIDTDKVINYDIDGFRVFWAEAILPECVCGCV